jgi:competence protein ComEC
MKKTKTRRWRQYDPFSILLLFGAIAANAVLWYRIIFSSAIATQARVYFLDVGQGDSELVILPGNVKIMTDAGPDDKVLQSLARVLPQSDTYIDAAIISHPQLDHFGGYGSMLDHYRVGVFIYNGRDAAPNVAAWSQLLAKIKEKNIPLITLGKGDAIHYENNEIDVLSPDINFAQSGELNDTGLVELVKTPGLRALFTADIGFNIEDFLLSNHLDIRADVLKVAHHGSKYASSDAFLRAVDPKVAVVEVAAKNSYGQPSSSTLARIASSTNAKIFRTDRDGTITVSAGDGAIEIVKEK